MSDNIVKAAVYCLIKINRRNKICYSVKNIFEHIVDIFLKPIKDTGMSTSQICSIVDFSVDEYDIDKYTRHRKLSSEELSEFAEELEQKFKDKGKYLHQENGKTNLLQLSFLIKTAFELELSFKEFTDIAYKAGYTFFNNWRAYPPYYFLQFMLDKKRYNFNDYAEGLTDKDNIRLLLKEKILSLESFSQSVVKEYFRNNTDTYKMVLRDALGNLCFQTDFIKYIFEAVYINGELCYEYEKDVRSYLMSLLGTELSGSSVTSCKLLGDDWQK